MPTIHPPTMYFFFAIVAIALAVAMLLAYFSVRRKKYFLYWSLYVAFFMFSIVIVVLYPVIGATLGSVFSNTIFLISALCLIEGFNEFSNSSKTRIHYIEILLSVVYVLAMIPGYLNSGSVGYRVLIASAVMSVGHVISVLALHSDSTFSPTIASRVSDASNIALGGFWLARGILGVSSGLTDVNSVEASNITLPLIIITMIVLFFTMVILSQTQMWQRLVDTELELDGATFRASTSTLFAGISHELGTPAGNALMALSHLQTISEEDKRQELINQAMINIEMITAKLRDYRRFIENKGNTIKKDVLHVGELLKTITQLIRRSENLNGISLELDDNLNENPTASPIIRTRPAVLFQGLLALLEISGRLNWITSESRLVTIGCFDPSDSHGERVEIHIRGIKLPFGLEPGQPALIQTGRLLDGRDLVFFDGARQSMEDLLDARLSVRETESKAWDILVISLPRG